MLKIKLEQDGAVLTMQVLEQSPAATAILRVDSFEGPGWFAPNGLRIASRYEPSLNNMYLSAPLPTIYVRGSGTKLDNAVVRLDYRTPLEATGTAKRITEAVNAFNSAHGFAAMPIATTDYLQVPPPTDKLPERTFKPGDKVWTPSAGFVTLADPSVSFGPDERPLLSDGRHPSFKLDGRMWESNTNRTILTLEEAAKLGLTPPKRKVKKTISTWGLVRTTDGAVGYGSANEADARRHLKKDPESYQGCEVREFTTEVEVEEDAV